MLQPGLRREDSVNPRGQCLESFSGLDMEKAQRLHGYPLCLTLSIFSFLHSQLENAGVSLSAVNHSGELITPKEGLVETLIHNWLVRSTQKTTWGFQLACIGPDEQS